MIVAWQFIARNYAHMKPVPWGRYDLNGPGLHFANGLSDPKKIVAKNQPVIPYPTGRICFLTYSWQ